MMRYTFCVDTQISTSRELNRVSPNNIAEKSTRYVYEDGTICRPHWMSDEIATHFNEEPLFAEWLLMLIILIYCYLMLIIIFNGKNVLV